MKKFLSVLLVAVLLCSLVACGGGNGSSAPASSNTTSEPASTPESTPDSGSSDVEETGGYDALVIPEELTTDYDTVVENWDEISDLVYDYTQGEFAEFYEVAKAETNLSKRYALMAIAEAKFLETGVAGPGTNGTGSYALTRIVPRTAPSVMWGGDSYKYMHYLITDDPLTTEQRATLRSMWDDLKGTGTFLAEAEKYVTEQGHTLRDHYDGTFSSIPESFDPMVSSRAECTQVRAFTSMSLMEYDVENNLQPALATSYEVSDDNLVYTFHLRDDIVWVDQQGREVAPLVADDFVAGMQHVCDAAGGLEDLLRGQIAGIDEYINGDTDDFTTVGVKALDDHTVEYTLQTPVPYFTTEVTYTHLAPMCRTYYESQGGKFGADYDPTAEDYTFGLGPDHIVYCGPYIATNVTDQAQITYTANPAYYDAENVRVKTINYWYDDGSDDVKTFDNFVNGTISSLTLNASRLEMAQTTKAEGSEETIFDLYNYVPEPSGFSGLTWINLNRQMFHNSNDESAVVSAKSDEEKARTKAALLNKNFRFALLHGFDRVAWRAIATGNEELGRTSLSNSYTPGDFVALEEDVTVDISGESKTFPKGTYYGEIMQAQLDADGCKWKAWDPETNSSMGFDGLFDAEQAKADLEAAKAELATQGIEINAENPIHIDIPYSSYNTSSTNTANGWKQAIDSVFGGEIVVDLVAMDDADEARAVQFGCNYGYEMNYDWYYSSGWNPDYGDPSSYLDTIVPGGYMVMLMGVY